MTIYFVRHSIRDTSVHDESAGLSPEGYAQLSRLVAFFKDKAISAIYSSPYERVMETIRPVALDKGLEIQEVADLRERAIGTWVADFEQFAQAQWTDFDYSLPGGESLNTVKTRIWPVFEDLVRQHGQQDLIMAGHGTALAVLFSQLTDFGYADFCQIQQPDVYAVDSLPDGRFVNFRSCEF